MQFQPIKDTLDVPAMRLHDGDLTTNSIPSNDVDSFEQINCQRILVDVMMTVSGRIGSHNTVRYAAGKLQPDIVSDRFSLE
jgi:hypothetical protein